MTCGAKLAAAARARKRVERPYPASHCKPEVLTALHCKYGAIASLRFQFETEALTASHCESAVIAALRFQSGALTASHCESGVLTALNCMFGALLASYCESRTLSALRCECGVFTACHDNWFNYPTPTARTLQRCEKCCSGTGKIRSPILLSTQGPSVPVPRCHQLFSGGDASQEEAQQLINTLDSLGRFWPSLLRQWKVKSRHDDCSERDASIHYIVFHLLQ